MLAHSAVVENTALCPSIFLLKRFIAIGAVPAFFILSGYLGAKKLGQFSLTIRTYFADKLRSLIAPYLFWNICALALVFLLKYIGIHHALQGRGAYFNVDFSTLSVVSALFGIGRPPIMYQFWALRDLIIVVFVAFYLCRYLPKTPLIPIVFLFLPLPVSTSLGYYLIGNYLYHYLPVAKISMIKPSALYLLLWLFIGICVATEVLPIPGFPIGRIGSAIFLFALATILLRSAVGRKLSTLGPVTFLIYAIHEPIQTVIAKTWLISKTPYYGSLFCFLIIPILVFVLILIIYRILQLSSPKFLGFITGGRHSLRLHADVRSSSL
jgi:fucose 4-O-acetylase-like acetyltransferase